jgi:hypothetical protein
VWKPGAHIKELAHAPGVHVAHVTGQEALVVQRLLGDSGPELPHRVGRLAVSLVIVLAAKPVIVHASDIRLGCVNI